jgi:signal transduction histidine kinase
VEKALTWYVPTITAQISIQVVMALVFSCLYAHDRKPFLMLWGIGCWGWVLKLSFDLALFYSPGTAIFQVMNQCGCILGPFFHGWGTMHFIGKKVPKAWVIWVWVHAGWMALPVVGIIPAHFALVPTAVGAAIIYFWTGCAFLQAGKIEVTGQRITGWVYFLTGLHMGNYPLLKNVEWFAPWGYLLGGVLTFLLAIGTLLVYYQQIIAERVEAEEELRRMEESRMNLLTNISHDLRTPLATVQGYIKAMLDRVISTPEKQYEYLGLVYTRILKINRLIQDLFDLTRLESRRMEFNLQQITIQDLLSQLYEKYRVDVMNASLNFNFNNQASREPASLGNMPSVRVDPDLIGRAFDNLIYNAINHTPPRGSITVSYEIVPVDEAEASLAGTGANTGHFEAVIKVIDTGTGIAPEDLPYIFNRYYRGAASAGKPAGGAGLGLAISKEIIEHHNGRIWVESELNKGSIFAFSLPVFV